MFNDLRVVLLCGGVGGAKLADGLAQLLAPAQLTIVVNTGDDFEHLGLTICPDLDTVMYSLAGVANPETGWGRADESWRTMDTLAALGGPDWFRLGDQDLATHLLRAEMLAAGKSLTQVTRHLCQHLGVQHDVLPMSDRPAPTQIVTPDGILPFQTWFVAQGWQPQVERVALPDDARAAPAVLAALGNADVVILAPSNPYVSIDPILNAYPVRTMVADLPDVVLAVSPIVGGDAVKGPTAKMMREWGQPVSSATIAAYYDDVIDAFVYDERDAAAVGELPLPALCVDTLMRDRADRRRLAEAVLSFAVTLGRTRVGNERD